MKNIYYNQFLPRIYFIPFFIFYFFLKLLKYLFFKNKFNKSLKINTKLLISAGIKGWESIEFKELLISAREYFGHSNKVIQHKFDHNNNFVFEIRNIIEKEKITHFFYDPRTGNQNFFSGFFESVQISILLARYNITPIVFFTDISFRKWRIKGAIVSSISGIAICYVTPRLVWPIFPHKRLYGPSLMPLSIETFNDIQKDIDRELASNNNLAYFIGSLYEPRTTILNNIKRGLLKRGKDITIIGRQIGAQRKPDSEYWKTMINSTIILTTSDQIKMKDFDWSWIPNLVYRYLEAISTGTLLIAPSVPCVERYFQPGVDFISFDSENEAINKIDFYLENREEREKIANAGRKKAKALIEARIFWVQIDTFLSSNSML